MAAFEVRNLRGEDELSILEKLDVEYYGENNIPEHRLTDWWKQYPKGIFAAFDGSQIAAAIGIWPLRRMSYAELMSGIRTEDSIMADDICDQPEQEICKWYIAGVIVPTKYRWTSALRDVLNVTRQRSPAFEQPASSFEVGAIATSTAGEKLLKRFGFIQYKSVNNLKDCLKRYVLTTAVPKAKRNRPKV
jgi:hypothetical protein